MRRSLFTVGSVLLLCGILLGGFVVVPVAPLHRYGPPASVLNSLAQIGTESLDWYGTGIVIREVGNDRLVLTAKHVAEAIGTAGHIRFQADNHTWDAVCIRNSFTSDCSLWYVTHCDLPALPVATSDPAMFAPVFLFGTSAMAPNDRPFGAEGMWQGQERSEGLIQHSAQGYPGQSGGALVNAAGELVGICFGGWPGTPLNVATSLADIIAFLEE